MKIMDIKENEKELEKYEHLATEETLYMEIDICFQVK